MRPKEDLHESRLLSATDDDDSSTILPLTRYGNRKKQLSEITETQKL